MGHKSILLVDDEPIILVSLARELTSENLKFDVSLATNGDEAVAKIKSGSWDLVVTDLMMPGRDGFQILKEAKRKDPHLMVIILTGYADVDSAVDALRLGADDFLQKPCDVDELLYRMSNCFAKQDLQRKVRLYENILPVCSYCKKIRVDQRIEHGQEHWYSLEDYFLRMQGIHVSHGCCPDCFTQQIADIQDILSNNNQ